MELHKKSCIWLSIIFISSLVPYFLLAEQLPIISNIFLAIFTGAFVSLCISLINYFHIKRVFLDSLFYQGAFLYKELENIKQLTENINKDSNYSNIVNFVISHSDEIANIIQKLNFSAFSTFISFSKESKLVNNVSAIIFQYKLYFIIKILELDNSIRKNEINIMKNVTDDNFITEILGNINLLHQEIKVYQDDFINKMNLLHKITKSKWNWEDAIKTIPENVSKNIEKYELKHIKNA